LPGSMHDADGRLDRAFQPFYDLAVPGGTTNSDDCAEHCNVADLRMPKGPSGRKPYMTHMAWRVIERHGLLTDVYRKWNTVFARKPSDGVPRPVPTAELQAATKDAITEYDS